MLNDRPLETVRNEDGEVIQLGQKELLDILEGRQSVDGAVSDAQLAEVYREEDPTTGQPMSELKIEMMLEMRKAKSPLERSKIKSKYADIAREAREQQNKNKGDS